MTPSQFAARSIELTALPSMVWTHAHGLVLLRQALLGAGLHIVGEVPVITVSEGAPGPAYLWGGFTLEDASGKRLQVMSRLGYSCVDEPFAVGIAHIWTVTPAFQELPTTSADKRVLFSREMRAHRLTAEQLERLDESLLTAHFDRAVVAPGFALALPDAKRFVTSF